MRAPTMRLAKRLYFILALVIGIAIVFKSLDYFIPVFNRGFLIGKEAIFGHYRIFLWMHVCGAPLALFSGLFQLSYADHPFHRHAGWIYVGSILVLAAPGGLGMAFYALGGMLSAVNFILLSSLWFCFTLWAVRYAINKHFGAHRTMMIRSFILTNSAVAIRLLGFANSRWQWLDPITAYIWIGWLSWVPALLIFELYHWNYKQTAR